MILNDSGVILTLCKAAPNTLCHLELYTPSSLIEDFADYFCSVYISTQTVNSDAHC